MSLVHKTKDYALRALALLLLLAALGIMLFPFFIVSINAFKTPADYAMNGPLALPQNISLQGLLTFWQRVDFTGKLLNSFIISLLVAVFGVCLSLLNAFALGIGRIKGRIIILIFFVIANTLPHEALAYPLYHFAKMFRIYDSQLAVILIFTAIQAAFGTYLLANVFTAFPKELVEAAFIDGAGKKQILTHIIAPMSVPTLAVLFTFFFIWTWNEFFLPLIFLISNAKQTVPIAISLTQGQHHMDATMASASALLGLLPCLLFFFIFQRTLTQGITAGSIK